MLTSAGHRARPPSSASGQTAVSSGPFLFTLCPRPCENGLLVCMERRQLLASSELPFRTGLGGTWASLKVLLQQQGHIGLAADTLPSEGASLDQALRPFWEAAILND